MILMILLKKYNEGYSSRKIAEVYNLSYSTILKVLKSNNVPMRNKSCNLPDRTSQVDKDVLYDLYISFKKQFFTMKRNPMND